MDKNVLLSTNVIKIRENADINNGCVIAVGSFDGVHIGHRALLASLLQESKLLGVPAAVFTFDPDDNPKNDVKLLAQPDKKSALLGEAGVEIVVSAPFSVLRSLSARDFAEGILFEYLGAKSIVCGYDFRFGSGREGDVDLVKELLSPKGVRVITPPALVSGGTPVSSTVIRSLVAAGDISKANRLLGSAFSFEAPVSHGAMLGRKLGFPTINQKYPSQLVVPRFGVYAVECVLDGKRYGGVANVGTKPTVGGISYPLCETHIFGYSGDCYGSFAEISFVEFIREEKRFSSVSELKSQVERDKIAAADILDKGV